MKSPLIASLALFAALGSSLFAQSTTIGRELPTTGINADSGRTNFAWAVSIPQDAFYNYALVDTFNFGSQTGLITLNTLSLWVADSNTLENPRYTLLAGYGAPITSSNLSDFWAQESPLTAYTSTPSTYINGEGYKTTSGQFRDLTRLDFTLNWGLDASNTVYFGLLGMQGEVAFAPSILASTNSPAFGGDGKLLSTHTNWDFAPDLSFHKAPKIVTMGSDFNFSATYTSAAGNPDITPVPEPSTYGLMGAGALALIGFVRRRRQARA